MSLHHCSAKVNLLRNERAAWMDGSKTNSMYSWGRVSKANVCSFSFMVLRPFGILVLLLWLWFFFFWPHLHLEIKTLKVTMNKRDHWGLNGLLVHREADSSSKLNDKTYFVLFLDLYTCQFPWQLHSGQWKTIKRKERTQGSTGDILLVMKPNKTQVKGQGLTKYFYNRSRIFTENMTKFPNKCFVWLWIWRQQT